jgi:hypothetical protein
MYLHTESRESSEAASLGHVSPWVVQVGPAGWQQLSRMQPHTPAVAVAVLALPF